MADLLTHVLVVYVVLTVASWRIDWLTSPWIAVAMGGAAIPDLVKVDLVLDDAAIETTVNVPFTWDPISTLGGVLVIAGVITLVFGRWYRRRAFAFLVGGSLASLVVDGLRVYADGHTSPWLYPFTWWRPPTPSLYVTSDVQIIIFAIVIATVVFGLDYWVVGAEKKRTA